jgi:hypothetical protein
MTGDIQDDKENIQDDKGDIQDDKEIPRVTRVGAQDDM